MRRAVALASALAALILSGCAAGPSAHATLLPTIPDYSNTMSPATYLTLMRTIPEFNAPNDADLVVLAESTCRVMRKDGWQHVMQTYSVAGHGLNQSYAAVQYAVAAYCPDLLSTIPAQ